MHGNSDQDDLLRTRYRYLYFKRRTTDSELRKDRKKKTTCTTGKTLTTEVRDYVANTDNHYATRYSHPYYIR